MNNVHHVVCCTVNGVVNLALYKKAKQNSVTLTDSKDRIPSF